MSAKFIGYYEAKLDDKGRVVMPSAFKALIAREVEGNIRMVLKKDLHAECLNMFTLEQWERESEAIKSRLNLFKKEDTAWYREYLRECAIVTLEAKVGRILIPKGLGDKIGVVKELAFVGGDFKIEIWAKEKYGAAKLSEEEFTALTEKLLG